MDSVWRVEREKKLRILIILTTQSAKHERLKGGKQWEENGSQTIPM